MTKTFKLVREFRVNTFCHEHSFTFTVTPGSRTVLLSPSGSPEQQLDIAEARQFWADLKRAKAGRFAGGFLSEWRQAL